MKNKSFAKRHKKLIVAVLSIGLALPLSAGLLHAIDMPSVDLSNARLARDNSGKLHFIGTSLGQPLKLPAAKNGQSLADVIANGYGPLFGIDNPAEELKVSKQTTLADKRQNIRYQQYYQGLPVIAGELVANVSADNKLLSISGEAATSLNVPTTPKVSAEEAVDTALAAVAKWNEMNTAELRASKPVLSVYDPSLISPNTVPASLVWRLEVTPVALLPIREFVLVDAINGGIAVHFNQVDMARNRETYDAGGGSSLPGTLRCRETDDVATCSGGDADVAAAHNYAGDTYDFYFNNHGRDSLDNAGMTLISTVNWNDGSSCPNAFWNGTQMVYCTGLARGDDVVGHELTHGVTEKTSGLFYYYQSGAINESLSDVWGEFIDLGNGAGNDGASVRWQMGEDAVNLGVIRDMSNPPAFNHPDRMTSSLYYTGTADRGGVHTNSGINNKAAYLMADGDTFNGQTVTALGITKTAKIYYEAQTNILTSGSDYGDLYNALYQGCLNLVGSSGITSDDCTQVQNAINAVEMNQQPVAGYNPEADVCPSGQNPQNAFYDTFESGLGNWTLTHGSGSYDWVDWHSVYGSTYGDYATSGVVSLFANDGATITDRYAQISVTVPSGTPYLHFRHAFDFEAGYDGGVVEYSTDGGATWNDAMGMFDSGKNYNYTISSSYGSPIAGRSAFSGASHGYVSTRLNLSSLAGQTIRLRWREGTDSSTAGPYGWWLDDVRVYTCVTGSGSSSTSSGGSSSSSSSSSGSSGGGGGCSINMRAGFDPLLPGMFLLAMLYLLRRRITRS